MTQIKRGLSLHSEVAEVLENSYQRHHDCYVRLYREKGGKMNLDDQVEYMLAMKRERRGEVKPLED